MHVVLAARSVIAARVSSALCPHSPPAALLSSQRRVPTLTDGPDRRTSEYRGTEYRTKRAPKISKGKRPMAASAADAVRTGSAQAQARPVAPPQPSPEPQTLQVQITNGMAARAWQRLLSHECCMCRTVGVWGTENRR